MTPIAPHISAFLRDHLPRQKGASVQTCESYAYAFKLLFTFASQRLKIAPSAMCLEQIDAQLVMDFLQFLETERNNGIRTRNARLVAIKSFMRFLEYRTPALLEQIQRVLAIPTKRTEQRLIHWLTNAEVKAVLNAPDLRKRDGIRDRAMLHLCFAGTPVSCNTLFDYQGAVFKDREFFFHISKRILPCHEHTVEQDWACPFVRA